MTASLQKFEQPTKLKAVNDADADEHYLRKELYERLRTDEALFSFIERGSLDGIWYWDLENDKEEWLSPRFKEFFGYEDHEMANTTEWWQAHIHPQDLPKVLDNFKKHCADPDHPYDQVVRYQHRRGHTVWVRCRGLVLRDPSGKPVRMLGAHTDVTEQERQKREVEQLNQALREANDEMAQFVRGAAHDLQSPLRDVCNIAAWLVEDEGDRLSDKGLRQLELINARVGRIENLLTALRNQLKARQENRDPDEDVDLDQLLVDTWDLSSAPESFEIKLQGEFPSIRTERAPLMQVLANLMQNAVRHHDRPSGLITVTSQLVGDRIEFTVEDDGPGIPKKFHRKIFEMFTTLSSKDEREGSGMGLALVKTIVASRGGLVSVSSAERGTKFSFSWPTANEAPRAAGRQAAPAG